MQEKIKVNLSYNVYNLLQKDMEDFRFNIKDGIPNKNLFYNTIVKNMIDVQRLETTVIRDKLSSLLNTHIKSNSLLNDILDKLEEIYNYKIDDKTNRSHGYYISFRPSKKLEDLYDEILDYELKNNTISNYFRNLFNNYARLAQDERERIIYKDELKIIESAINTNKTLNIKLNNISFEFIPYEIVRTNDELYNYLIGGIRRKDRLQCISLHLYKCNNLFKTKNVFELTDEEKKHFDDILVYGPREVERRTVLTKIKLTKAGIRKFKSMYLNRPIPIEINDNIYTFNCSHDNLFLYFSRFGVDAEILEPLNLRNQIISFHRKAYNKYKNNV
ncbi:MAG: hypothetical protein J6R47_03740 [Acholeplasmatales bacterium]|nr:hypothetical protein [Acholeplasmatales bacterium]